MDWHQVLLVSQLQDNGMKVVEVAGKKINLAKTGGSFFAFDDTCTHHQCSLSEGFLEGTTIECSCHGAQFDIKNGGVLRLPATVPLATYPVKVEGDAVFIGV